jgi:hypothetical protein
MSLCVVCDDEKTDAEPYQWQFVNVLGALVHIAHFAKYVHTCIAAYNAVRSTVRSGGGGAQLPLPGGDVSAAAAARVDAVALNVDLKVAAHFELNSRWLNANVSVWIQATLCA